jgi:hypothetical protein
MARSFFLFWLFLLTTGICVADLKKPVRIGDLQITATAAGPVTSQLAGLIMTMPSNGHHFVVVSVKVKNVAASRSCTEFDPMLEVDSGENRYGPSLGTGLLWPETVNLPPSGESEGKYVFEVEDGTRPVALTLVRHSTTEDLCAMSQERPVFAPENREVRIDLEGLPGFNNPPTLPPSATRVTIPEGDLGQWTSSMPFEEVNNAGTNAVTSFLHTRRSRLFWGSRLAGRDCTNNFD